MIAAALGALVLCCAIANIGLGQDQVIWPDDIVAAQNCISESDDHRVAGRFFDQPAAETCLALATIGKSVRGRCDDVHSDHRVCNFLVASHDGRKAVAFDGDLLGFLTLGWENRDASAVITPAHLARPVHYLVLRRGDWNWSPSGGRIIYDGDIRQDARGWRLTEVLKLDGDIENDIKIRHDEQIVTRDNFERHPWPLIGDGEVSIDLVGLGGGLSGIPRGARGLRSIADPFAHVTQLEEEHDGLEASNDHESKGECRYGVCRRPTPKGFIFMMIGAYVFGALAGWGVLWLCGLDGSDRERGRKRDPNKYRAKD